MPGSVAAEKGLKAGEDKFRAVNGFSPRIITRSGEKIGLGTREYKLVNYEPVLTPENIAKWQIRPDKPTTVRLRDTYDRHDLTTEVMPFERTAYSKERVQNEWKKYDPYKGEKRD
jgi:hypothetical protein